MRRLLSLFALPLLLLACEDQPAASVPDTGVSGAADTGAVPDAGAAEDAELTPDALSPDAPAPDAPAEDAAAADTGLADSGAAPDAAAQDAAPADAAPQPDAGQPLVDSDGDGISDGHEGNGQVDTDGDGTPDSQDQDSDQDGLSDRDEAGDGDLATPPVDTDGDGLPDFRDTDSDGNGIPDAQEGTGDPDGDGIPSWRDLDDDGDFIRDVEEGGADPDGDSIPNRLDTDSDADGAGDAEEAGDQSLATPPRDADFDGTPDFLDLDSDNDTISDAAEGSLDSDGDGLADRVDTDSDADSVPDSAEAGDADLATVPVDSDGDGTADFRDLDSDGDTIADLAERSLDPDGDGAPNRLDLDSDNDGVTDAVEAGDADLQTPPRDTDLDLLPDYVDLDSDGDGLGDQAELGCPLATNRLSADSDGDGFIDPAEIAYGSNPCSAASGIDDFYFVLPPNGPQASAPLGFTDTEIDRADLAINMDNTGSMGGEIANLRNALSNTIVPAVRAVIPDSAFAVSSFDDYPLDPFGQATANDRPFRLLTRATTDVGVAQAAVNGLVTRSGLDFPESGLEALYQVATGLGTSWPGGSVAPFNPAAGLVPNVADGTIGGVGFRNDALPIIVQITDAISHTRRDYQAVNPAIAAASTADVRTALGGLGARVVSISSGLLPFNDLLCSGQVSTFFGALTAGDVDWFQLPAAAGDAVTAEVLAAGFASDLDPMVAITNGTAILAQNDDISPTDLDARATVTLFGAGPFYVAVARTGDTLFNGAQGSTSGHYAINVSVGANAVFPSPTACRAEDGNNRGGATALSANGQPPASFAQCLSDCDSILGAFSPLFQDLTFPVELSEETGATVPACAWSVFGTSRPTGCAVDQCCTGLNGAGVPPNSAGVCPLAFEIDSTGAGLSAAMVAGIQALVRSSPFTISTVVRPDPLELLATGFDTTCFMRGVIPTSAVPPNSCASSPTPADLVPPPGELDSFLGVVPGTQLTFQVNAINQDRVSLAACRPSLPTPQLYRAYIDLVADGVTVVDTRDVIIIVPPAPPGGSN